MYLTPPILFSSVKSKGLFFLTVRNYFFVCKKKKPAVFDDN